LYNTYLVAKSFLPGAESSEIFCRLGHDITPEKQKNKDPGSLHGSIPPPLPDPTAEEFLRKIC
jgi:hypothetical protein